MDNKKISLAFEFNYQDCYMAKMEAFSGDCFPEYVGTILMPKRHSLKHKGEPFKLWPGVYKVSFSFEDGY